MKKIIKKTIITVLCLAITFTCLPAMTVKADDQAAPVWVAAPDGTFILAGTDITAKVVENNLHINGNGAIPDYTPMTYAQRPWDKRQINILYIGSGITEIGSFAFGDMTSIKRVELSSGTFIKDSTCFFGMSQDVAIRIKGITPSWKYIGTIPYSSLESLAAFFGKNPCIMDSADSAAVFRCMDYPFLKYVYEQNDKSAPWSKKVDVTEGFKYNANAKISPDNNLGVLWQMYAQKASQGSVYLNCISQLMGEYNNYVCSYNMILLSGEKPVYGTNGEKKYILNIPANEQSFFKQFRLIEVGPAGTVFYLDDLDDKVETITFKTAYPTSTYALVYKWDMDKLAPYLH